VKRHGQDLRVNWPAALAWLFAAVLVAMLIGMFGCASDRRFVADAAAERIYQEDRYERACVKVKGPAGCQELADALNLLEHHEAGTPVGLIPVANRVQQLGKVPPEEKKEIRAVMKRIRRLP
jgi:hypothetical protein